MAASPVVTEVGRSLCSVSAHSTANTTHPRTYDNVQNQRYLFCILKVLLCGSVISLDVYLEWTQTSKVNDRDAAFVCKFQWCLSDVYNNFRFMLNVLLYLQGPFVATRDKSNVSRKLSKCDETQTTVKTCHRYSLCPNEIRLTGRVSSLLGEHFCACHEAMGDNGTWFYKVDRCVSWTCACVLQCVG